MMDTKLIDKAGLIYLKDKKVLVSLSRGKDTWYIPAGKREEGETYEETLIREMKEELDVDIKPATIKPYSTFEAPAHGKPEGTIVKTVFYTADVTGEMKASAEVGAIDFFNYNQKNLTSDLTKKVFDDLKNKGLIE